MIPAARQPALGWAIGRYESLTPDEVNDWLRGFRPDKGGFILDVGAGSGRAAALLSAPLFGLPRRLFFSGSGLNSQLSFFQPAPQPPVNIPEPGREGITSAYRA